MAANIDFDFFDDTHQPCSPRSREDDGDDVDRQSVRSSNTARSTSSSVKIEARVPSVSVSKDSGSSDTDSEHINSRHKSGRPRTKKVSRANSGSNGTGRIFTRTDKRPPKPTKELPTQNGTQRDHSASSTESSPERSDTVRTDSARSLTNRSSSSNDTFTVSRPDDHHGTSGRLSRGSSTFSRGSDNLSADWDNQTSHRQQRSRSRSSSSTASKSSQWSTGSENDGRKSRAVNRSRRQHHRSSSESSISVSSLSDVEPESQAIVESGPSKGRRDSLDETVDKDRLNLQMLLSALLEADSKSASSLPSRQKQPPVTSPTNQSRLAGQQQQRSKGNYSFSADRARMIDLENQRLLQNILAQRAATSKHHQQLKSPAPSAGRPTNHGAASTPGSSEKKRRSRPEPTRVTHATVNRMREQQRVERENLALLRRLNKIKPSAEINRSKLLTEYDQQMSYHCPQLRTTTTGSGSGYQQARPASSQAGRRSRPSSATSRPSSAPLRPSSAYSSPAGSGRQRSAGRPLSATSSSTGSRRPRRPEWETGW